MDAVEEIRKMLLLAQDVATGGGSLEGWSEQLVTAFAALGEIETSDAVRADGETWVSYAHRLEERVKQQRADLNHLAGLRDGPHSEAKKKIERLEQMLGHKEMRLSLQHDGLKALRERLEDATGASGAVAAVVDMLDRCGTATSMVYVHETRDVPACAVIVRAGTLAWDRVHVGMPVLGSPDDEGHGHVEPGMW